MSRIITNLKAWWMSKTPAEKAKSIMHGVITIGGAIAGNDISDKLGKGHTKVGKACIWTLCTGATMALEDVASREIDAAIDEFDNLIQQRKAMKEQKEAEANG